MTTLTSAGAVNLTSSTNWSPAQTPVAGDDLIIGAHTLTLDADMTLGSVTFNNISSRLAISGTTRTLQATNGFTVATNLSAQLITTTLAAGTTVTLTGRWIGGQSLPGIASSSGGNLLLQTIGALPGDVLFADIAIAAARQITSSWTAGTLTTIGRFDMPSWTASSTLVAMSGGTWNHTNTGTSRLGAGAHTVFSGSGTSGITWSGDLTSDSTIATGLFLTAGSTAPSVTGTIKRTASNTTSHANASNLSPVITHTGLATLTIDGVVCNTATSRGVSIVVGGSSSSCRLNWRNQTRSIGATDAVIILNGNSSVADLTSLSLSNAGRFVYLESGSAQAVVGTLTTITNTTSSAQACVVSNSGALDGKVVNLASTILRIPAANEVASGSGNFGYSASPITPTGLVVDPAVIAAAMSTALNAYDTNGVASRDDLAAIDVDLTPVLAKLPVAGRAATAAELTVNPTVLSAGSIADIRSGLGTTAKQDQILTAIAGIDAGGLTPEESETLDSIAVALAGSAPVEPTGTTVFQHLEQIQDSIDTYVSSALATVNGTQDTIVGFPDSLTVGDSYTEDSGNAIHVFIRDGNDDPISSVGSHDFTDTDFTPELVITNSGNAGRVRATVTYIDPGSSEPYLKVEIPLAESRRAAPGSATMQCVLKWNGCAKTLATQSVTWVARI